MSRDFLIPTSGGTLLNLRVSPRAKNNGLAGRHGDDALRLRVAAPPVDGKANIEAERYLAGLLGLPRSGVVVVKGASSRDKAVLLKEVEPGDVRGLLEPHLA